jgi:hypothetical protein
MIDKQARENEKRKSLEEATQDAQQTANNKAKRATLGLNVIDDELREFTISDESGVCMDKSCSSNHDNRKRKTRHKSPKTKAKA